MSITNNVLSDKFFNEMIVRSQMTFKDNEMLPKLVRVHDMVGKMGNSVTVPVVPAASTVTEHTDLAELSADTAFNTFASKTIAAKEYANYQIISKKAYEASGEDIFMTVANALAAELAEAQDRAITGLFDNSGLTQAGPGTAADNLLTVGDIMDAAAQLRRNKAPIYVGMVAVLDPRQAANVKKGLLNAGGNYGASTVAANTVASRYWIGSIAGVDIYESAVVKTRSVSSVNVADGAIFVKPAISFVNKRNINLSYDYDVSRIGWELALDTAFNADIVQSDYMLRLTSAV